ncbi:MAG: peptidase M15 [Crocinitomix sp.]|nr:peptidase M15 [Crocinitomix sp.]
MRLFTILILCLVLTSCGGEKNSDNNTNTTIIDTILNSQIDTAAIIEPIGAPEPVYIIDTLEQRLIDSGLVNIEDIIPGVLTDVRYSDTNNFMATDVYGHLNRIYLQPSVAADLKKCQDKLKEIDSTLTLLVYDGVRPRSVQQYMWDILDMPIGEKVKFVSNPKNGSLHNYGAAVDLTIADSNGFALDMGAGYDDIRKIAYPRHEAAYLDSGMLTQQNIDNRDLLRDVMRSGGFWGIQTEWWHFNRYSRDKAKGLFDIVE